jgi:hypothetical protein
VEREVEAWVCGFEAKIEFGDASSVKEGIVVALEKEKVGL